MKLTVMSTDRGMAFQQVQHLFMIKTLKKLAIKGTHTNIIKAVHKKSLVNIIPNELNVW